MLLLNLLKPDPACRWRTLDREVIAMLERPRLKPYLLPQIAPPETVYLLSERAHFALSGSLYVRLVPHLDGRLTTEELVEHLETEAEPTELYYALMQLETRGFLCEGDEDVAREVAGFWSGMGQDPLTARSRLAATGVRVVAFGGAPSEPFAAALAAAGCRLSDDGEFGVVLVDDYLRPELDSWNRESLEQGRSWLLVKPVGLALWLGPLFRPGQTGCWACLAQRLRGNRQVENFLWRLRGDKEPFTLARADLPSTVQTGLALAATETARAIALGAGQAGPLDGKLLTLDLASLQTQSHWLTRRPQCPRCGQPGRNGHSAAEPLTLQSRKKTATTDGGYRTNPPEETLRRLGRHVSPITGAVTVLEPAAPVKDSPMYLYSAGHNWGRPGLDLPGLRMSLRSRSGGKGVTDIQARASAVCEAIERYAALYRGDEPVVHSTLAQLGADAFHPNDCQLFSETQFQQRETFNSTASPFHWVSQQFDETRDVAWAPAWSLTANTVRYVPAAFCYFAHPLTPDHQFCRSDSNGCAAGNTREEAILQGLLELVERDSVALWWYNRIRRPRLDLASFSEPYFATLANFYHSQGRDIQVLDITSDLGIPSFAALSWRKAERKDFVFGFGTHLDPAIGVLRAVTEMNQMFSHAMAICGDNGADRGPVDRDLRRWFQTATPESQPYLVAEEGAPRCRADFGRLWTDDLRDDIQVCVDIVGRHGLEVLVVDQTQPDIELDVVKVIVPGLRHFWPRFAPGRLYDVPVRMGWLPSPLREDQLNPIPMFW